jgi:hypothetical protein
MLKTVLVSAVVSAVVLVIVARVPAVRKAVGL